MKVIIEERNFGVVINQNGVLLDWNQHPENKDCDYFFTWDELLEIAKEEK